MTHAQRREFEDRGFSRRSFGRIATLIAAGGALPFYNEAALAQLSASGRIPEGAVKIDANENPLGPCPEAAAAMQSMIAQGGRYMYDLTDRFCQAMAEQEGLRGGYVRAFAGSSAPLHQAVLAFTSPERPLVTADPGYEAGEGAARFIGSGVIRVPLTKAYAHDVKAMAAASPNAGLIYVCNPNNPTGTVTPRADIEWLLENKPAGSVVLLDEAYIHLCNEKPCIDLVAKDKDVVVLRTFSKLYGMAGIRAGAALARPDLLSKVSSYSGGAMPITAMAAAIASLQAKNLVTQRRKIVADIRAGVFSFLEKNRFSYIPSVSNKFMVDVRRPGREVIAALRQHNIYIGRVWPSWPNHVRVTVGTEDEMNRFQTAFLKVMG